MSVTDGVRRRRVVIVGAGVMGSATAWWLARQGHEVTLVEQFGPAHEHGSSHGCSRIFRLAYGDPRYARAARVAFGMWRRLEEESQEQLLHTTGGVDHGLPGAVALVTQGMAAAGVRFVRMRPGEAGERWPGARFESAVIYQPDAGRISAEPAVLALRRCAAEHGAAVIFDTAVTDIRVRSEGAEVVLAPSGVGGPGMAGSSAEESETTAFGSAGFGAAGSGAAGSGAAGSGAAGSVLAADVVVLSVGAWLPAMLARLRGQMPGFDGLPTLRVTQEQPAYFPLRAGGPSIEWPVILHHRAITGGASNQGFGYYGLHTPERGIKVGEHATGPEVRADGPRPQALDAAVARIEAYVAAWLPGTEATAASVDTCLYTSTPDGEFVLRREGPVVVCSACSGHGFKFAPLVGSRAAALATGAPDSVRGSWLAGW